jgi:hypothetical protein
MILQTEKEYRNYDAYNYSSLKEFDLNRLSYYYKYVEGIKDEKPMSYDVLIGSMVDCLLFTPKRILF